MSLVQHIKTMNKTTVIKVGGSILSTSEAEIFNLLNATKLKEVLERFIKNGDKFILCVGGGYLVRKYQKIVQSIGASTKKQHQIGIAGINLNAEMLSAVFAEYADLFIPKYKDFDNLKEFEVKNNVLISAAGSPGHSSDWNTVKLALASESKEIISLKNIDGVYTADPKKDPLAKKIDSLSWDEYLNAIGNPSEFTPGGNYPVDPLAAKLAKENNISFYILDGRDLSTLQSVLEGGKFSGTKIH